MKTIIVPMDFSPISVNAANFATDMALAVKADVLLLNVYNIPVAYSGDVPLMVVSLDVIKNNSEQKLAKVKSAIDHVTAGKINIRTLSVLGNTIDELETLCKQFKPFAIVMGTKGKSTVEKFVFGSTTLAAIRHLTWPVICVPPGKEYGKGIKKIGFACDFRHIAQTTPVHYIREMVKEFGSELHVLNVDYKEKRFRPDTPLESEHLHEMCIDLNPIYHFIVNPNVEEGIDDFAEKNNLDLIIAIPKKHKLLEGMFRSSNTKQLIFQSHVPVMCVHE
jgi:nucleotide-binding universal stress UspA family protein